MSKKKQKKASPQRLEQQLAKKHARYRQKWRNAALAVCGAGLIGIAAFGMAHAGDVRSGDLHGAVAAETEHYQVSAAMLAYYFQEHVDSYLSYAETNPGMPVFDAERPLDEQYYDENSAETWYSFFMQNTVNTVQQTLQACEAAYTAGYTLPEETRAQIAEDAAATDLTRYQSGVTEADVAAVMELQMIGRGYQQQAYAEVSVSEDALAEELAANPDEYVRCGLACFTFDWEAGDDAEMQDAKYHAEEMAECSTRAEFLAYAKSYMEDETTLSDAIIAQRLRAMELTLGYSACGDDVAEWVKGAKVGDTYIYSPEGSQFTEVMMLTALPAPDEGECVDLRVIYIPSSLHNGDMDATVEAANTVIAECEAAGSTPEAFAQLVMQYSADSTTASAGGLIEGYSCNRTEYGAETAEWAFAAGRKQGDMFICERESAVVVAYYEGKNALLGWQNQVKARLTQNQYNAFAETLSACTVTVHEENTDLVTGQSIQAADSDAD